MLNRPRSFRIQAERPFIGSVLNLLSLQGYRFQKEPFGENCYELLYEPLPLGSSWAAFFGYIYIQDRSSMLPPLALQVQKGESVLDMCASPGSKTTFLADLVGKDGCVLANEIQRSRLFTLQKNCERLNALNVATTSYNAEDLPLYASQWNAISLDPPCSGWGTVEKNPKVTKMWQGESLKRLCVLQRKLLRSAAKLLAPHGRLLYSTCTTNKEENEDQVRFCEEELGFVREALTPFEGFVYDEYEGGSGTLRINGEQSSAQGFYLALLRKEEEAERPFCETEEILLKGQEISSNTICQSILDFSRLPKGRLQLISGGLYWIPMPLFSLIKPALSFRAFCLGSMHGSEFLPNPRLRCLFGECETERDIVFESLEELRLLIQGQKLTTTHTGKFLPLWFRDLPLGIVSIKNGRIVSLFR